MKVAVKAKFKEGNLKQKLQNSGHSVLVEATRNYIWGTGVPFISGDVLNPQAFKGQNLMGTILMEVRNDMLDASTCQQLSSEISTSTSF